MGLQITSIVYFYQVCTFERSLAQTMGALVRDMSIWSISPDYCQQRQMRGVICFFAKAFLKKRVLLFCEARRSLKAVRLEQDLIGANL